MIRKSLTLLIIICLTSWGHAVTRLSINNAAHYSITSVPEKIVLSSDVVSIGNTLLCEFFLDVNDNKVIDTHDQSLAYFKFKDGLGWIRDSELPEEGIPGDETPTDGVIETTLTLDDNFRAFSRQTWLVRMTDQDNSTAIASMEWRTPFSKYCVKGIVQDQDSLDRLAHAFVSFRNDEYADVERVAVTDADGAFAIDLFPGKWIAFASNELDKSYRNAKPTMINVASSNKNLVLNAERYAAFIEGVIHFNNGEAVENVTVALQNKLNYDIYYARTDEYGKYKIGVDPGEYVATVSQYASIYLGNHYWPEGFYAKPAIEHLSVASRSVLVKDFQFKPYPAYVRGECRQNGVPLQDVLVQGIAVDSKTGEQLLYQTFSNSDGSFSLGVESELVTTVVAQKEGGYIAENPTFRNIDMRRQSISSGYTFNFARTASLMSLSGVVHKDNSPVRDVCVVAFNSDNRRPESHLIAQTDENGAYYFDIKMSGDWQVGVFENDFSVHPPLYYQYMSPGLNYRDLDFALSTDGNNDDYVEGELHLADFNLTPHFPDPFYKETVIDFVLPKSSYTQIDVLDMDGEEVTSLVNDELDSGYQKIRWDGADDQGNIIANGVYFCRIKYQEITSVQPITLLR